MTRGNAQHTQVHYKGKEEDFVVFVENAEIVRQWRDDKTIPLAQVVAGFKIFVTHGHGNQGILDGASKATLANEFGTDKEDDVISKIIQEGKIVSHEEQGRSGTTNITQGGTVAH